MKVTGLGIPEEHPAANGMRILYRIGVILWIILLSPRGYGDVLVPADICRESSEWILEGRYDEAERVLDRFISTHPDEPSGYLLKAAAIHYRAVDYDDFSRGEEINALLDRAEAISVTKSAANHNDLWASYFLHSARTVRGAWEVSSGSFVHGMLLGRSGAGGMARILALDPKFYDAYLVDGSYRFWKSNAARGVRLGALVGDDRARGIREVREAIDKGLLTGPLSRIVLLEMLLACDPDAAVKEAGEWARRYPSCHLFAWQLGEAFKKRGDWDGASGVFNGLAERYASVPDDDGSGQVRCWWKLAVLARDIGKKDACRNYCERIIPLGDRETVRARQAKRLEGARKMLTELNRERN